MHRLLAVLLLAGASVSAQTITQTFGSGANQFSIDFVEIGNPGNTADTTGAPNPVGSVSYLYNLGKYEISRDMIDKANLAGSLNITMTDMWHDGTSRPNNPATGITWREAAKFVNFLNTTTGNQAAYKFDSNGNLQLWSAGDSGYDPNNKFRNNLARFFMPSTSEWYKGAYGSPDGSWFKYPTASNIAPSATASGTSPNTAVFGLRVGPADIFSAGGLSAYETMGQGGNVWELIETAYDGVNDDIEESRELRGGTSTADIIYLESSERNAFSFLPPDTIFLGFRVAMVPEPSSPSLLLAGGAVLMAGRRRKVVEK